MQYKCKVTVIDKKLFYNLQSEYLKNPESGVCPFYNVGDETIFERYGGEDTFWREANGAHCAEAWDCISRYIYAALQGGAIMRGWTRDEHIMIACCNDGTRPVVFKIERLDYKVLRLKSVTEEQAGAVEAKLKVVQKVNGVTVRVDKGWAEVFCNRDDAPTDEDLVAATKDGGCEVLRID